LFSWVLLLYLPPPCSSHSFSLLFSLSLLILSQILSQINHEDKANEGNINIPLATSSLERKILEYIAAQTQVLQVMAQTMVKIHQSITEQASVPKDHNTVTNDNHQNVAPPPFDKEKLSAM
jgi:N-acetyl-anhydromuramyl-L-alanine amidase AmpD